MGQLEEEFWRNGFALVRQVFMPAEVAEFRQAALDRGKTKADLLSDRALRHVLLDDRLLGIFRTLIGHDLVYFGDSSVMIGATDPGFHKDNVDKDDPDGPDW